MKERTLLKIALIGSLVGMLVLYIASSSMEIQPTDIDKINKDNVGGYVKILGKVDKASSLEKVSFLEVSQPSSIEVVVFENLSVNQGDYVEIIGQIDEYEGELEIIGKRIRKVS